MWVLFIILKIILYLFLAFILLLATLLIVPFTYRGEAAILEGVSFSYRLGWFWNLFTFRGTKSGELQTTEVYLGKRRLITVEKKDKPEKEPEEEKAEKEEKEETEAKKENNLKSMFEMKFIKEAFEYLKKILRQVKPKHLHMRGVYGFEDPSLTGMTAGFIYSIQAMIPSSRIQLQPYFAGEIFELEAEAEGRISGGRIAYDTIRFVLKPEIRKKIFKRSKKVKPKSNK